MLIPLISKLIQEKGLDPQFCHVYRKHLVLTDKVNSENRPELMQKVCSDLESVKQRIEGFLLKNKNSNARFVIPDAEGVFSIHQQRMSNYQKQEVEWETERVARVEFIQALYPEEYQLLCLAEKYISQYKRGVFEGDIVEIQQIKGDPITGRVAHVPEFGISLQVKKAQFAKNPTHYTEVVGEIKHQHSIGNFYTSLKVIDSVGEARKYFEVINHV